MGNIFLIYRKGKRGHTPQGQKYSVLIKSNPCINYLFTIPQIVTTGPKTINIHIQNTVLWLGNLTQPVKIVYFSANLRPHIFVVIIAFCSAKSNQPSVFEISALSSKNKNVARDSNKVILRSRDRSQ